MQRTRFAITSPAINRRTKFSSNNHTIVLEKETVEHLLTTAHPSQVISLTIFLLYAKKYTPQRVYETEYISRVLGMPPHAVLLAWEELKLLHEAQTSHAQKN